MIYKAPNCKFDLILSEEFKKAGIALYTGGPIGNDDYMLISGMRQMLFLRKKKVKFKNFLFLDTGYFGNFNGLLNTIRVIPNNLHPNSLNVPTEGDIQEFLHRYDQENETTYLDRLNADYSYQEFSTALIIPPSEKYCRYHKMDKEKWIQKTLKPKSFRKTFDDFEIRDKTKNKVERFHNNPITEAMKNKRALICYSSLTSIDAAILGLPFIDTGDGPIKSLSSSFKSIKMGLPVDKEKTIDAFNKLMFYQADLNSVGEKLLEIVDFHKELKSLSA